MYALEVSFTNGGQRVDLGIRILVVKVLLLFRGVVLPCKALYQPYRNRTL